MLKKQYIESIQRKSQWVFVVFLSIVIDSFFLGLWVVIQYVLSNRILSFFILAGIDKVVLKSLKYVFAFTTLIPVLLYTFADLIILCKQFKKIIK